MDKIPCEYAWSDEYHDGASVEVAWDDEDMVGLLRIEGVGDGTLELEFAKEGWDKLSIAIADVLWELFPEDQQNEEEG
jgi:hypothetical protein